MAVSISTSPQVTSHDWSPSTRSGVCCGELLLLVRTPVRTMGRHERLIEQAMRVASTSQHKKWQLGAVLTRGSTFLSSAPNKFRNPPWINPLHASRHAEMEAVRKSVNGTRGATIYVARVDKYGRPRMARPCSRCMLGLYEAGIREVVYTTDDGSYKIERVKDLSENSSNKGVDTPAEAPLK
jgi:tRNA(Arg) A34 adenosine deaminase TadA